MLEKTKETQPLIAMWDPGSEKEQDWDIREIWIRFVGWFTGSLQG